MANPTATEELYSAPIHALDGTPADLHVYRDKALLIVNVASQCGLTPHYAGLERLHEKYSARGFAVLGFPCNQFGEQEPGTPEEIQTFCSTNYAVSFPLFEKIDVNGEGRHPVYAALTGVPDEKGHTGDITWNFEKFVVSPGAGSITRFSPTTDPEAEPLVAAIEAALPG
ncbi:MAG TPA: glutathione peroxidase [Candidatus Dormibacteraeota bacterium]